jgi:tetratricopeptide (TPR) repeat protein
MARIGSYASVITYKLAVAKARRVDDPLRLAHTVRHLGDAYYYAKRPTQAEPCYVEALSIYRKHEQARPLDVANAIRSFAVLKDENGEAEEAQRLWQEAHDLYVAISDAPDITESWRRGVLGGVAESAARLALLAWRQGDLPQSRKWLGEASAATELSDDPETLEYMREVKAQIEA